MYGGKAGATRKSIASNTRHRVGDGHGGKASAIIESIVSNARHGIGDNGVLASGNQRIGCGLNDGITVISGIICCVSAYHFDGGKAGAVPESHISNARHGIADGHGGKVDAIAVFANAFISNACVLNGRKVPT